jgi:hypothetical protein
MSAKSVIEGASVALGICLKRHVATECPFHHVHTQIFESRASCNRNYRSRTCFDKHKTNKVRLKSICERKRSCAVCNKVIMSKKSTNVSRLIAQTGSEQEYWSFLFYATVKERIVSQ